MPRSETVTFIDAHLPALDAGDYRVTVTQTVASTDPAIALADSFTERRYFSVRGQRFAWDPAVFHSVHPPAGAKGDFSRHLPHVVLRRRSLPWERSLLDSAATDKTVRPWVALLLFRDDEGVVEHEQLQVGQLRGQGAEVLSCGPGELGFGESESDPCSAIDIPVASFHALAPAFADIACLAHARVVDGADYSVIVGNRVPRAAGSHTAHLVSLDGMGAWLPDATGQAAPWFDTPAGRQVRWVRLVSLRKWSFSHAGAPRSFRTLLENLHRHSGEPPPGSGAPRRMRYASMRTGQDVPGLPEAARKALDLGYSPHNHHLRGGDETVSWYRGPCIPHPLPATRAPMLNSADAALRYDPDLGMFDVSLACAWQLGRLAALASPAFATALLQWKKQVRDQAVLRAGNPALARAGLQRHLAAALGGKPLKQPLLRAAAPASARHTLARLGAVLHDAQALRAGAAAPAVPAEVAHWLGRLLLLHPVPFDYLVPDAALLPRESIQFFHVDPDWLRCLLDGACSVGANSRSMLTQDGAFADLLRDAAARSADATMPQRAWSGFLLRSDAVPDFPGLQVEAFDRGGAALPLLRQSRLQPDVLLVLCSGVLARLHLHQPPEGLHFGLDRLLPAGEADHFEIQLRSLRAADTGAALRDAQGRASVATGRFRDSVTGVVAVAALAGRLQARLDAAIDTASFALQMVQGADQVRFDVLPGDPPWQA